MISLFLRELFGWLMLLVGLAVLALAIRFLTHPSHQIIEGGICAFIGVMLFRSGMGLQRAAMAARVVEREFRARRREEAERDAREASVAARGRPGPGGRRTR